MDLFLSILKSVIYGVIEGITEWLPISSTGHMILAEQVLKFGYTEDFMEMFRVVIQLGAILAVVVLYFHKLWPRYRLCRPPALARGPAVVQNYCSLHARRRAGHSAGRLDGRPPV